MNRSSIRRILTWLIVAAIAGFAAYKLTFAPVPVVAHTVARGEIVAAVTCGARVVPDWKESRISNPKS